VNYADSEGYLFSLGNEVLAMKLGLQSMTKLLAQLGDPHKKYFKVQIAGTNGKGSVCAFLEAICLAAGIRTGLFTSPHLTSVTERIRINGEQVAPAEFARHATLVREACEELVARGALESVPTFFEQVTAIAVSAFADQNVEIGILETGLGGRYDATTAANAEIAGITQIGYDHVDILGHSIAEIASEKAAIIRADSQAVVVGEQRPEALEAIEDRCRSVRGQPFLARSVRADILKADERDRKFRVNCRTSKADYKDVCLALRGRHQIENAKIAILLAEALPDKFRIREADIINGLETAVHSGRLEYHGNVLFDGAHNVEGARALRAYLDEFETRPITFVFGVMEDKNIAEIAGALLPRANNIVLTQPNNLRAARAGDIVQYLSGCIAPERIHVTGSVSAALKKASEIIQPSELICVTGSLYLVGEARKILNNKDTAGER
jgi:dihydrofolate synthase/folylpolyglutamate synthase